MASKPKVCPFCHAGDVVEVDGEYHCTDEALCGKSWPKPKPKPKREK